MNRHSFILLLAVIVLAPLLLGCSVLPASASLQLVPSYTPSQALQPLPTYTRYPTYTPYPTLAAPRTPTIPRYAPATAARTAARMTGDALPLLRDFTLLNLQLVKSEIVNSISDSEYRFTPNPGYKIVVVSLQGFVPFSARIAYEPCDFVAMYETAAQGSADPKLSLERSDAVAVRDYWALARSGVRITSQSYFDEPSPVIIKVAFTLPNNVTKFGISYPTAMEEQVTLPSPSGWD